MRPRKSSGGPHLQRARKGRDVFRHDWKHPGEADKDLRDAAKNGTDLHESFDAYTVKAFVDVMMNRQPVTTRIVPDVLSVDTNILLYQAIGAIQELDKRQRMAEKAGTVDGQANHYTKSEVIWLCLSVAFLSLITSIAALIIAVSFVVPRKERQNTMEAPKAPKDDSQEQRRQKEQRRQQQHV